MVRVKRGNVARKRRDKVLKLAKGFRGSSSTLFRQAKQSVTHALSNAFRGRRDKKSDFRRLWTIRINAATRQHGLSYSLFIKGLKEAKIGLDRKILAQLAVEDENTFSNIVEKAKSALKRS
jgi:large subunit ribosomal protein L20